MYYRFLLLNANVGDVLYQRFYDKESDKKLVRAVKIVSFYCGKITAHVLHSNSYVKILIAGNGDKAEYVYIGSGSTVKFYRSVEDCINDRNPVEKCVLDERVIASECGMNVESFRTDFGMSYCGVYKFKWDGYMPKRIEVALSDYNFVKDENGWHSEFRPYEKNPTKYYDTYEECIADNSVNVVVF